MKKKNIIIWIIWFILIVLWNYVYPEASPFLDVLIAVLLSVFHIIIIRITK